MPPPPQLYEILKVRANPTPHGAHAHKCLEPRASACSRFNSTITMLFPAPVSVYLSHCIARGGAAQAQHMLDGWVNPQRATNYTARSNIDTAQIFLHANGQTPIRRRSRRRQRRGEPHIEHGLGVRNMQLHSHGSFLLLLFTTAAAATACVPRCGACCL